MDVLNWMLAGNSLRAWLLAALVAAAAFFLAGLVKALLTRQLKRLAGRTATLLDDVILAVVRATRAWFLFVVALWAGMHFLRVAPQVNSVAVNVVIVTLLLQMALWSSTAIRSYVNGYSEAKLEEDAASVTTVRALGFLLTVVLWSILFLVALDNMGIDITAMVAGLGVGGIAVALAVQNILGDLFGSLSIVLDKPFVDGDFIIVDDLMGTVEHIGLKTTRVRSLSGEQLVFANSDLLKSRIRNYKRMYERRVVFKIGVIYQTSREALERIPGIVREIVESLPDTRFDRAHFKEFGDFSLNFEIVYYVLLPDFNTYMDRQQAINLELFRRFEAEGIEFAYPTQTLLLERAAGGR